MVGAREGKHRDSERVKKKWGVMIKSKPHIFENTTFATKSSDEK